MYEQVKALKEGIAVEKPIYNHVSSLLDPPEVIKPPKILVIEGLHPIGTWLKEDTALRASKAASKPENQTWMPYIDPQKQFADAVIEVLPTQLIQDDEGKIFTTRSLWQQLAWKLQRPNQFNSCLKHKPPLALIFSVIPYHVLCNFIASYNINLPPHISSLINYYTSVDGHLI